jgi:hypothetical protein
MKEEENTKAEDFTEAIYNDDIKTISKMIEEGFDINEQHDVMGGYIMDNKLMYGGGIYEEVGENKYEKYTFGWTPLQLAVAKDSVELYKLFLEKGAKEDIKGINKK